MLTESFKKHPRIIIVSTHIIEEIAKTIEKLIIIDRGSIGFFMYKRPEAQAETAVIYRFMLGSKYRDRGLEAKALEHVLKGLKIQGVKKVSLMAGECDKDTKNLCLSFGFHPAGETGKEQLCYELEM